MSDVYDSIWESRKRKPPARLVEVKAPYTDRERVKDTIERRRKCVWNEITRAFFRRLSHSRSFDSAACL